MKNFRVLHQKCYIIHWSGKIWIDSKLRLGCPVCSKNYFPMNGFFSVSLTCYSNLFAIVTFLILVLQPFPSTAIYILYLLQAQGNRWKSTCSCRWYSFDIAQIAYMHCKSKIPCHTCLSWPLCILLHPNDFPKCIYIYISMCIYKHIDIFMCIYVYNSYYCYLLVLGDICMSWL